MSRHHLLHRPSEVAVGVLGLHGQHDAASNGDTPAFASSSIELVSPPGSKKSRSDRSPCTTVSADPATEPSDTVEKLSCSADDRVKHDSIDSTYTESVGFSAELQGEGEENSR
ncbi:hypothetical protein B296_00033031 [Ensete ventricosum]|uniref:Uncharacterized protein n=1 Tax=Ensete ventricosum TaxID=4639 RepID=A0A426X0K2_ENSVE|nr:hypothetical protein B296_00033031 [Ensete ventricosum]